MAEVYNKKLFIFAYDNNADFAAELLEDIIFDYEKDYSDVPLNNILDSGLIAFLGSISNSKAVLVHQISCHNIDEEYPI